MITPLAVAWDPLIEADHLVKRGIPFAARVFLDADRLEVPAEPDRFGVPRFRTLGRVEAAAYAVVFSMRGDTAYIVSVRRASKRERRWL